MKQQSTDTADIDALIDQFNEADFALMVSVQANDRRTMTTAAKLVSDTFENLMTPVPAKATDRATLASFLCDRFVFSENCSQDMLRSVAAKLVDLASIGPSRGQAIT